MFVELVKLGKVVRLHGIKGEFKIATTIDKDFDEKSVKVIFDAENNRYEVKGIFRHDGGLVVSATGFDIERARSLIGKEFFIERSLVSGKILIEDIKGSAVFAGETKIGIVTDVEDFGSAEIFYIKRDDGSELLVPNARGIIESFDYKSKLLKLNKKVLSEVSEYED